MSKPFRFFFHFALAYHAIAVTLVVLLRENWRHSLQYAYIRTKDGGDLFSVVLVVALAVSVSVLIASYKLEDRIPRMSFVFAVFGTWFFIFGFLMIKSLLPVIIPYFADPYLADFDRALHLGTDPWRIAHYDLPHFPAVLGSFLYGQTWYILSLMSPVAVALMDPDKNRQTRFVLAYLGTWIILGNLMAIAFMSGGPVFYDRLTNSDRFAEFALAFAGSGLVETYVAGTQHMLWLLYTDYSQSFGSGISAFPSVHVALATLYMLYLWDVSKILGVLAGLFLLFVLYFSVFTGFHYAIDGYVSICLLFVFWRWLKKLYPQSKTTGAVSAAR